MPAVQPYSSTICAIWARAFRIWLKARASENACYIAGANRVDEDVTFTFGGESMIVGPRGKVAAHLPGLVLPNVNRGGVPAHALIVLKCLLPAGGNADLNTSWT